MNTVGEVAAGVAGRRSLVDGAEAAVREWLAPGRFRGGDRLPTEQELAAMLGISRGTLRSALHRLERTGEIVRRQGSGTFVGRPGPTAASSPLRVETYSANAGGTAIEVGRLEVGRRSVGPEAARALGIAPGTRSMVVQRTLLVAGRPVIVAHDTFHPDVPLPGAMGLRRGLQDGQSIFQLLLALAIDVAASRTSIEPILLDPSDELGRELALPGPTACLELRDVVGDGRCRPILFARDVMVPGGLQVEVRHTLEASMLAPLGVG